MQRLRYSERANYCKNALAKKLFLLMDEKKTNLALSADVTTADELIEITKQVATEICVLKTHIDIIDDFTPTLTQELQRLADQHGFLIFEDRKFADIGNTVKHQYEGGIYQIANWAHIINAHSLPGDGIVKGLAEVGMKKQRGLLLLAEMSSENNLFSKDYIEKTIHMAEAFPEYVIGFIAQRRLSSTHPEWIYMTPGIQLTEGKDTLGQQYNTPQTAITQNGTDIIIVGRGITSSKDPKQTAAEYRKAGWQSYETTFALSPN